MSGDVIQWGSMWGHIMASSRGMPLKGMKSWKVVDVVVVAMVGDGRDVVTISTESDVMGSICSCDIMIDGNARITIRIISIIY
jgi:hypothetical protein